MKTAIDWIQEELAKTDQRSLGDVLKVFEEAKAMFHQQIEDAYRDGLYFKEPLSTDKMNEEVSNYYTTTYGE